MQYQNLKSQSGADGLDFYNSSYSTPPVQGNYMNTNNQQFNASNPAQQYYGMVSQSGHIQNSLSLLSAFGTGSIGDEPPLLEELEINILHMWRKTVAVLNPFKTLDKSLADDSDCWGPIMFILFFAASLLLTGKALFGFIYGVATIGWLAIYTILNLMSENGINGVRTASVLGYCLLPMAILSWLSIVIPLQGFLGFLLGISAVIWCTVSSSSMFVTALSMREQRILVAYPVGLFYFCFALMTIF